MISASCLGFTYAGAASPAVSGIDLSIGRGDFLYLTGPSGCGKSTLLNLMAGILSDPDDGVMTGTIHTSQKDPPGLVIQNVDAQFFNLRVWEELRYGPENMGLDPETIERNVFGVVCDLGIEGLLGRETSSLSMGERQLVAIASVLAMNPGVVLLDEPTANLDYRHSRRLYGALANACNRLGATVVLADHRNDGLGDLVTRTVILDRGRVAADGGPELLVDSRLMKSLGIRIAKQMNRNVLHGLGTGLGPGADDAAALDIRNLNFARGGREILKGVSIRVGRGEIAGLLGEPGSGKTTLGLIAAGILKPGSGEASVMGLSPDRALASGEVGMVLQNPKHQLFCDTVEEEIEYAPRNFDRLDPGFIEYLTDSMGLAELKSRSVHTLSGGQSQRLAIASGLSARPGLIILDEPTSGQDWANLEILGRVFDRLRASGTGALVMTHDWRLANRFFDTCHFLEKGVTVSRERYLDSMLSGESDPHDPGSRPAAPRGIDDPETPGRVEGRSDSAGLGEGQ